MKGVYSVEEIIKGDGFAIIKRNEDYTIEWPQGPFGVIVSYPIKEQFVEKAFRSPQDAYEVMIYVQTGIWPQRNKEEEERNQAREIVRKFPELLLQVPDNKELFTERELKELLPLAKKKLSELE